MVLLPKEKQSLGAGLNNFEMGSLTNLHYKYTNTESKISISYFKII